eukprot:2083501-Pleurochrysis_carterae.AAC.4
MHARISRAHSASSKRSARSRRGKKGSCATHSPSETLCATITATASRLNTKCSIASLPRRRGASSGARKWTLACRTLECAPSHASNADASKDSSAAALTPASAPASAPAPSSVGRCGSAAQSGGSHSSHEDSDKLCLPARSTSGAAEVTSVHTRRLESKMAFGLHAIVAVAGLMSSARMDGEKDGRV